MINKELAEARRFHLPGTLAEECCVELRRAADDGDERFLALTAEIVNGHVYFRRSVTPKQTCHHTDRGLLVKIDSDAIFDLNRSCYDNGEILAGQIHAHPKRAYHSQADDELALVRLPGGLSIVVPNFAVGSPSPRSWAKYQLHNGAWKRQRWRTKVIID